MGGRGRHEEFLEWFPVVSRYLGAAGLVFCATVWLATDRLEPTLLGMFGALLGLSQGTDALKSLKPPPADPPKTQEDASS
jgi:hypothetical protein